MLRSTLRLDSGGQRVASWTATRRPSQKRFMASMRVKKLEVTPLPMNPGRRRREESLILRGKYLRLLRSPPPPRPYRGTEPDGVSLLRRFALLRYRLHPVR
jgi:hypothetical protein